MPYIPSARSASPSKAARSFDVAARSSIGNPPDAFDVSQALFAGLSVFIALLALGVGLAQLKRHRGRITSRQQESIFELEAGCFKASSKPVAPCDE
jgi:hypothetical protein